MANNTHAATSLLTNNHLYNSCSLPHSCRASKGKKGGKKVRHLEEQVRVQLSYLTSLDYLAGKVLEEHVLHGKRVDLGRANTESYPYVRRTATFPTATHHIRQQA